jgi:hypothetical protein
MSSFTDFGYGQLGPEDANDESNILHFVVRSILSRLSTVKVVQVQAVHAGTGTPPLAGTVDVLPMVSMVDGEGNVSPHGVVYGVPYFRLQAGPWAIIADPAVNDVGLMVCADRDISYLKQVFANTQPPNKPVNPGTFRMFDWADGIYFGGLFGAAPTAYFQLKSDGTLNITDAKGNVVQTSSSGFALTGNLKVTGTLEVTQGITGDNGVSVTGNVSATGTVTGTTQVVAGSGGSAVHLSTHTHSGVQTGAGTSGPPVPGS